MTDSPTIELQRAIIARLEDGTLTGALGVIQAELAATIGARIYSNPHDTVDFPYVTMGRASVEDEDEECRDVEEIEQQIHVWSRKGGWTEARRVATLMKALLHDAELDLDTHALRLLRAGRQEELDDPDNRTVRVILIVRAEVENLNVI